jgi:WD40 repeat protein
VQASNSDVAKIPLPEFYGLYALDGGSLFEFKTGQQLATFTPTVQFIAYDKAIAFGGFRPALVYIPLKVKKPLVPDEVVRDKNGNFSWEGWIRLTQVEYPREMNEALTGVPSDGIGISIRNKGVSGQTEMMQIAPASPLEPGLYQIDAGHRFWIERDRALATFIEAAKQASGRGQPAEAVAQAQIVLAYMPDDPSMQKLVADVYTASAKEAQIAREKSQWQIASEHVRLALLARNDDPIMHALARSLPSEEAIGTAKDSFNAKRWTDAQRLAERARQLTVDPVQREAMSRLELSAFTEAAIETATVAQQAKRWKDAIDAAQRGLSRIPTEPRLMESLKSSNSAMHLDAANNALAKESLDKACDEALESLKHLQTTEAAALLAKARALIRTKPTYFGREFKLLQSVQAHRGEVHVALAGDGDGVVLASYGEDGVAKVWDPRTGKLVWTIDPSTAEAVMPIAKTSAKRNGSRIVFPTVPAPTQRGDAKSEKSKTPIAGIALSDDGTVLATVLQTQRFSDSGTLVVWHVPTQKALSSLPIEFGNEQSFAISKGGKLLVARPRDVENRNSKGSFEVFDLTTGSTPSSRWKSSANIKARVRAFAFSPDGLTLISGGESGAEVWSSADGRSVQRFDIPKGAVCHDVRFSEDGRQVAVVTAAGIDGPHLRIFDIAKGNAATSVKSESSARSAMTPDFRFLVRTGGGMLVGFDRGVEFFDLTAKKQLGRVETKGRSASLAFSSDARCVAIGTLDGHIEYWGVEGGLSRLRPTERAEAK